MVKIQKKLTPYNFNALNGKKNTYIVVHYVGAASTALNNATYYANNKVKASAHYFVDETSIWQSVKDNDVAWHCGGGLQGNTGHTLHGICTNSNSIGIEMCVKKDSKGKWYFEPQTISNTIDLIKQLMKTYKIPIEKVIRHYDVTGKICPEPLIDSAKWNNFKASLLDVKKKELTNPNDIVWELSQRINITDTDKAVKALERAKKEDSSLYWILYKIVNK